MNNWFGFCADESVKDLFRTNQPHNINICFPNNKSHFQGAYSKKRSAPRARCSIRKRRKGSSFGNTPPGRGRCRGQQSGWGRDIPPVRQIGAARNCGNKLNEGSQHTGPRWGPRREGSDLCHQWQLILETCVTNGN